MQIKTAEFLASKLAKKRDNEHLKFLEAHGITEYDVECTDIRDKDTIVDLKNAFRVRFPLLM